MKLHIVGSCCTLLLAWVAPLRSEVLLSASFQDGQKTAEHPVGHEDARLATEPTRQALPKSALLTTHAPGPWPMEAFTPPAPKTTPVAKTRNVFEGRLRLEPARSAKGFHVRADDQHWAQAFGGAAARLPEFDFEFVQSGDALLPVRRGSIASNHPEWEFILEPGRVWDEAGDGDYTRAALPFTLEERNENCMHNGVLTFLFRSDGAVSDVAFEIGQETCIYFQFDWWGYAPARYSPGTVAARAEVAARYRDEVTHRIPTRPIAQLAQDFPGAKPENFASPQEISPQSLTAHGVLVDGVHYVSECPTRFGPYPFCDVMDLPSYSLSKSIVGGIGTMRFNVLFPHFSATRITDLVSECGGPDGWQGVTVKHVLDMLTGRYLSRDFEHDEMNDMGGFFVADSHAKKLKFACTHYPRQANPGEVWVYRTTDTYVLGTALAAFYKKKSGANADFYRDVLTRDIWTPLHLSPVMEAPRRTYDVAQQVFSGYGLTLHRDDIAKIGNFLNAGHGHIGDQSLLDQAMLEEALQRVPDPKAFAAGSEDIRYRDGFWAWNAQHALHCSEPTWVPLMGGFGGIVVELLPNGMIYYYFSDGGLYRYALGAAEANRIKPFCKK